jgi:hypothetical protein
MVLRFFALRNANHYTRGMRGFLDLYMAKASKLPEHALREMEELFNSVIETADKIYGDLVFRPFDPKTGEWANKPQKAFCDAVLVGIANNLNIKDTLIQRREDVIKETAELIKSKEEGTFTGRKNSKRDILTRITLVTKMLRDVGQA